MLFVPADSWFEGMGVPPLKWWAILFPADSIAYEDKSRAETETMLFRPYGTRLREGPTTKVVGHFVPAGDSIAYEITPG